MLYYPSMPLCRVVSALKKHCHSLVHLQGKRGGMYVQACLLLGFFLLFVIPLMVILFLMGATSTTCQVIPFNLKIILSVDRTENQPQSGFTVFLYKCHRKICFYFSHDNSLRKYGMTNTIVALSCLKWVISF